MTDKKLRKCPQCSQFALQRLIGSGTGIIFKGSGFYATDYRKKEPAPSTQKGPDRKPSACAADPHSCACAAKK